MEIGQVGCFRFDSVFPGRPEHQVVKPRRLTAKTTGRRRGQRALWFVVVLIIVHSYNLPFCKLLVCLCYDLAFSSAPGVSFVVVLVPPVVVLDAYGIIVLAISRTRGAITRTCRRD